MCSYTLLDGWVVFKNGDLDLIEEGIEDSEIKIN